VTNDNIQKAIDLFVSGDKKAFRVFYDYFYLKVYRFVRYFLPDAVACGDVVSEVFCIVWEKRALLSGVSNAEAYLFRIARNEAFHYIKQSQNNRNVSLDDMPVDLAVLSGQTDDQVMEDEMMQVFHAAVNKLPERCKLIFLMVREQKLPHREVAEILGVKQGTVEAQMNIAITKITTEVSKYFPNLLKKRR
jgi:RNA polymerase sigma-70 factor (ECF subfamily)